jgi:vanillate O-demethylase ferredoxin subunit
MHELAEGDEISVSAPRNNFAIDPAARHHVLLGGGIGITPLLSMARHLQAAGASFELHYFARSEPHAAFRSLLAGSGFSDRTAFHYGLDPEALSAHLRNFLAQRADGAHLYLCGPRPFMDLIQATAAASWAPDYVHLEYFGGDAAALAGPQEEFSVKLASSGAIYAIPAGVPITEILASHGCPVDTSCEQGVCGTCLTGVIEGVPDHRDLFLTEEEQRAGDKILPCVSRAKTPLLVLDL